MAKKAIKKITTQKNKKDISPLEILEDIENVDVNQTPPSDLVAYTEFRSTSDIYRMFKDGLIKIPDFQRKFIWSEKQQALFIDSLVKQLPIPSLCFALDFKNQTWSVVDGLQRISTIIKFLEAESTWRINNVEGVDKRLINKTASELRDDQETTVLYRKISNITLPITVLRCDMSNHEHANYIFTVFYRLNTGGTGLNAQEIRNSMFSSGFNELLNHFVKNSSWENVLKKVLGPQERQRLGGQQFLLRCIAFSKNYKKYSGGITVFLNNFMLDAKHRFKQTDLDDLENTLQEMGALLEKMFTCDAIKNQKGGLRIITESLYVGLTSNPTKIDLLRRMPQGQLNSELKRFLNMSDLSSESLSEGTASKSKILNRIKASIDFFK